MAYETIIVDIADYVCTIRLNRPDALNAINSRMLGELATALRLADCDKSVRCVILTGSEKAFAAGADVREMADKNFVDAFCSDLYTADSDSILCVRKPIIAAVSGYALGGGLRIGDDVRFYHCGRYSKIWSAGNQSGNHGRNWWHPAADAVGGAVKIDGYASYWPVHGCG